MFDNLDVASSLSFRTFSCEENGEPWDPEPEDGGEVTDWYRDKRSVVCEYGRRAVSK